MSPQESPEQPRPPEAPLDEHPPEATPFGPGFPVVGVGASAGGLESFTELLTSLPNNPGVALLYVSHLEPHHKSHLPEILEKITQMPVHEVREGMTVESDHLYIMPPNTNMGLADGSLWQVDEKELVRFRCHVGHVYHGEALLAEQEEILEAALWTAIRTFKDRGVLSRQLANQERERGNYTAASGFDDQAEQAERYGSSIQQYLLGGIETAGKEPTS
jgi:hypothetical protein